MSTFRVWLQIERDDGVDNYDNTETASLGRFEDEGAALRLFRALVTAIAPEVNDDYAYPIEEVTP